MEKQHRNKMRERFPQLSEQKPIVCLYIEDIYDYIAGADNCAAGEVRGCMSAGAVGLSDHSCPTWASTSTTMSNAFTNCSSAVMSLLSISTASGALIRGSAARVVSSSSRRSIFSSTLA